ncbi:MAG: hypothetical protein ABSG91_09520 [Syntrophobacteraceae bacterium]|jgi:hypothetical protein
MYPESVNAQREAGKDRGATLEGSFHSSSSKLFLKWPARLRSHSRQTCFRFCQELTDSSRDFLRGSCGAFSIHQDTSSVLDGVHTARGYPASGAFWNGISRLSFLIEMPNDLLTVGVPRTFEQSPTLKRDSAYIGHNEIHCSGRQGLCAGNRFDSLIISKLPKPETDLNMSKIAIVGTSNSILAEGWSSEFRRIEPNSIIHNYSLGSNSSLYGVYTLIKQDIASKYDYCILDFCVNDQNFLDCHAISWEFLLASIAGLFAPFLDEQVGCTPLWLLFINKRHFKDKHLNISRDAHMFLCSYYGVPYIDVYDLIVDAANTKGYNEDDIFAEETHLRSAFAKPLAHVVSEFLDLAGEHWAKNKPQSTGERRRLNYRVVPEDRITYRNCAVHTRSTSLISYPVHRLGPQSFIDIMTYDELLCGFLFWLRKEENYLFCTGERTIRKNLRLKWDKGFFFRNFLNPLQPARDGRFTFSLSHSGTCSEEYTQHEEPGEKLRLASHQGGPKVEIVDFLFAPAGSFAILFGLLVKELSGVRPGPPFNMWIARHVYNRHLAASLSSTESYAKSLRAWRH